MFKEITWEETKDLSKGSVMVEVNSNPANPPLFFVLVTSNGDFVVSVEWKNVFRPWFESGDPDAKYYLVHDPYMYQLLFEAHRALTRSP